MAWTGSTLEAASFAVSLDDRGYIKTHLVVGHATTITTLSYAIRFWSKGKKRALFLRHEGFLYVPCWILFVVCNIHINAGAQSVHGSRTLTRKRFKGN